MKIISAQDVIDYINKNAKTPILCPACQSQNWVSIAPTEDTINSSPEAVMLEALVYVRYEPGSDSAIPLTGAEPVVRLMCDNCSYNMIFSYRRMKELILGSQNK